MTKERLHHFDILKGIAIFMVIMGHIITMCIRDIDNAVLFKFVEKMHMPMFFFISGYFSYKVLENGNLAIPKLGVRVKQLLIPFFVMSTLWIYYFPHSGLQSPFVSTWEGLYTSIGKNGYWFTLCLFEIILIYSVMTLFLSRCKTLSMRVAVILISWLLLGYLSKYLLPEEVNNIIGLPLVFEFYPVFMFGALAHSEREKFDKITKDSTWITISMIIGAFLMYYVCWSWEFSLPAECLDVSKQLLYICVIIIAVAVVKSWCIQSYTDKHPNGSVMARMWEYVGSKSLAIYVLHYFFLFPMAILQEPLREMNLNIVPTLVVAAIVATIIIVVVLGINYIIGHSKLLALLMTGNIK